MYYVLIQTEDNVQMYQEIERGSLVRYCDFSGNTLPDPTVSNWVIDAAPTQPSWALADRPLVNDSPRATTRLEFRNRFTMAEKVAIYDAADTNLAVKIWLDDLTNSEYVNLNDPYTISSINALVQMNLITETRGEEILNA